MSSSNSVSGVRTSLSQPSTSAAKPDSTQAQSTGAQLAGTTPARTSNPVQISTRAQQLSAQSERWSSMSKGELRVLYDRTMDEFVALDRRYEAQGRAALEDMPDTEDPERLELAKRAAAYNDAIRSTPPGTAPNPFAGVSRDELTSIIYDDTGTYTLSERYAAWSSSSGRTSRAWMRSSKA